MSLVSLDTSPLKRFEKQIEKDLEAIGTRQSFERGMGKHTNRRSVANARFRWTTPPISRLRICLKNPTCPNPCLGCS